MEIVSAVYGSEDKYINVLPELERWLEKVQENELENVLQITNEFMGGDPVYKVEKYLTIHYSDKGVDDENKKKDSFKERSFIKIVKEKDNIVIRDLHYAEGNGGNGDEKMKMYIAYDGDDQGGLGDFIRSWLCLYVYNKKHDIESLVCVPTNRLRKCIECLDEFSGPPETMQRIWLTCHQTNEQDIWGELEKIKAAHTNVMVMSNIYFLHYKELLPFREEFKTQCLRKTQIVTERMTEMKKLLKGKKYVCLHIRCGDKHITRGGQCNTDVLGYDVENVIIPRVKTALAFINEHYSTDKEAVCVISDNEELKQTLKQVFGKEIICFNTIVNHLAVPEYTTDEGCVDTVAEFFLLSESSCNIMFAYSGFSIWSSFIYDVPLYTFNKTEEIVPYDYEFAGRSY